MCRVPGSVNQRSDCHYQSAAAECRVDRRRTESMLVETTAVERSGTP